MTGRVPEFCPGDGVQCCNVSGFLKSLFGPLKQSTQDEDLSGTSLVSSKLKALKIHGSPSTTRWSTPG